MTKTNFDLFLEEQLRDPDFAERFKRAGLSQVELARKLRTTQQQISRLESPNYEGHSLSMQRRVARVLNAHVRVIFESNKKAPARRLAEQPARYRTNARLKKGPDHRIPPDI